MSTVPDRTSGGFALFVRMWVEPEGEAELIDWLAGGHLNEVAGQPGFLSAELVRLGRSGGRSEYLVSYRIESADAFERYEADAALKERFAAQRASFDHLLQVERVAGSVIAASRPSSGS